MSRVEILLVSWLLLPTVSVLAFWGLGTFLALRCGISTPVSGVLTGFVAFVALAWVFTGPSATIPLALVVAVLAVAAGVYVLLRKRRPAWPSLVACSATYACYSVPFVLSAQPTWAGWIKLDDTASFLAITTRIMEGGREPVAAPASSYELVVSQIASGLAEVKQVTSYPTGAFTPLAVISEMSGVDAAWLIQPCMALFCALLAVGVVRLLVPLTGRRWAPVLFGVVAAQAAILYGFFLWGGFKEVALAVLLCCVAVFANLALEDRTEWKRWLLFLLSCFAFLTASGRSGLPYVLAPLVGTCVIVAYRTGGPWFAWLHRYRPYLVASASLVAITLVFLPEIPGASGLIPQIPDIGNLIYPLEPAQVSGVWPVGDFRLVPERTGLVSALVLVALALAVAGTLYAIKRRAWGLPLVTVPAVMVLGRTITDDQVWLTGKAMAVASPFVLASSFAGVLFLLELAGRVKPNRDSVRFALRVAAGVSVLAIVAGVGVSNALANREVWLAPFDENRELEQIGNRFRGQGPTLLPSGAVYATRHFLRDLAAESPDELRTRSLDLRGGVTSEGPGSGDISALKDRELDPFQLVVAKRSPSASVPPPPFALAYRGRFFDVWRRDPSAPLTNELIPLGSDTDSGSVPDCRKVKELARRAGSGGQLAYVARSGNLTIPVNPLPEENTNWPPGKLPGSVLPVSGGSVTRTFRTDRPAPYTFWMLGSFPGRLTVELDGKRIFRGSSVLAYSETGAFPISVENLDAGPHQLAISYSKPTLLPGSDARVAVANRVTGQRLQSEPPSGLPPLGPVVIQPGGPEASRVETVPASQANSLCGRRLDWVAAISSP